MLKIRNIFIVLGMLLCSAASADVRVNIGINVPVYPDLVVVPGYPVYYAPQLQANYFFYDGMYWVYQDDNWYSSSWYNGPWWIVGPEIVPVYVLRIPVRYYRRPPPYFYGWRSSAPPHWGDRWGRDWEQRRSGWDRWDRHAVPSPAPIPVYQRRYSGDRYPRQVEQQQELQKQNYNYQPREPVARQHDREQVEQRTPEERGSRQRDDQAAPRAQSPQREYKESERSAPPSPQQERPMAQDHEQQSQQEPDRREQQMPNPQSQDERQQRREVVREPKRGSGQGRERDRTR